MESWPLNCQGIPWRCIFCFCLFVCGTASLMRFYGRQPFTHVTIQLLEELSTSCGTLLAEDSGSLCLVSPDFALYTFALLFCFECFCWSTHHSHEYSDMLSPMSPPSISSNQGGRERGLWGPDIWSSSRGYSLAALETGQKQSRAKKRKRHIMVKLWEVLPHKLLRYFTYQSLLCIQKRLGILSLRMYLFVSGVKLLLAYFQT